MDKKIKVLIIVDAQNDFITGSLANKDAQKCIPAIVEKINDFDGDAIFLTMDTHFSDYLNTPEGKKLPVEHCAYATKGWEINSEIAKAVEDKELLGVKVEYILKPTFGSVEPVCINNDCLPGDSLVTEILNYQHGNTEPIPTDIELCGFCTDICVISNALILKAFTYDFAEITVDSKCCAGVTPEKHEAALEVMRSCQINVK